MFPLCRTQVCVNLSIVSALGDRVYVAGFNAASSIPRRTAVLARFRAAVQNAGMRV